MEVEAENSGNFDEFLIKKRPIADCPTGAWAKERRATGGGQKSREADKNGPRGGHRGERRKRAGDTKSKGAKGSPGPPQSIDRNRKNGQSVNQSAINLRGLMIAAVVAAAARGRNYLTAWWMFVARGCRID